MNDAAAIRRFFRSHAGTMVSPYPSQPEQIVDDNREETIELDIEQPAEEWSPILLPEQEANPDERPRRYIDGCQSGHAVACLRAPIEGWPIPLFLAELGGVAMELHGRELVRKFFGLERVLSFVADPFPWDEVEAFAGAIGQLPNFPLRFLPAHRPKVSNNIELFDYERMRGAAENRCNSEMSTWESMALHESPDIPTLVDGPLERRLRSSKMAARFALVMAVVKTHSRNYLHPQGRRTLLDLRPAYRTPYFRIARTDKGDSNDLPVVSWYVKLAGGPEAMPNWACVRVELAWEQFVRWPESDRGGLVNRLSRWLVDARCRQPSYARMHVSLEPIVRAEESLRSLFTPFDRLRYCFLNVAGMTGELS